MVSPSTFGPFRRFLLVLLIVIAAIVTLMADQQARALFRGSNEVLVDVTAWALRIGIWLLPWLIWPGHWDLGSLKPRWSWTILLMVLWLLPNLLFRDSNANGLSLSRALFVGMCIGIWEEIVFRGYALSGCETNRPRLAILLSALGFAALHIGYPIGNLIVSFFVGIGFGIVRITSGSLVGCVVAHGLIDALDDGASPPEFVLITVAAITAVTTVLLLWKHPVFRETTPGITRTAL